MARYLVAVQFYVEVELPDDTDDIGARFIIEENSCPGTGVVGAAVEAAVNNGEAGICWACNHGGSNRIVRKLEETRVSITNGGPIVTKVDHGWHWQMENKEPPLSLPWGEVYEAGKCLTTQPTSQREHPCCGRNGTYSKRVFLIVIPRSGEVAEVWESGGVFTPQGWTQVRGCPHQRGRTAAQ